MTEFWNSYDPLQPDDTDNDDYILNPFRLHRCGVCGATVDTDGMATHDKWHALGPQTPTP